MAKDQRTLTKDSQSLPEIKNWHAILVISLLVVFFFRDILLQKAFFWEDFLYQYYAFRNFAAVSLAWGELPLWNPYTFSGMPFQADIQTAVFYIPNLLLTLFVSGGKLNFYWVEVELVAHYIIAGVTMYYLAKSYGLHRIYALFSALVFCLSGSLITRLVHHTIVAELAWFPLVVLLFRKTLTEKSLTSMLLGGVLLGHTILAGSPQVSLYLFLLLVFCFVFEMTFSVQAKGLKGSLSLVPLSVGIVAVGLGVAAIQLLPTMELAPYSARANLSYEKSLDGSLNWSGFLLLLIPKLFGAHGAQGSTLWVDVPYGQFWETCFYLGIAGVCCFVFAITRARKNRQVFFFLLVAVFSLLYALGDNFVLHKFFFHVVPGFDKFREPGRMSFLFTFAAALLSGFGMQQFFEVADSQKKNVQRLVLIVAGVGIVLWGSLSTGWLQPSNDVRVYPHIHEIVMNSATTSLLLILVVCTILFLRSRTTISTKVAIIALFVVQFIDINVFGFDQNNGSTDPEDYYASTKQIVDELKRDGEHEYFRINSRMPGAMLLDRNQGMIDRVFLMEGYTPLALERKFTPAKSWERTCDLLNAKYRIVVDAQRQTMNLSTSSTYLPRAYVVYSAKIIPDEEPQKQYMQSDAFDPSREVVLEEDPHLAVSDPADTTKARSTWSIERAAVSITSYRLNVISLTVNTPQNGYLVFSEIYYPDWVAYIDGAPRHVYRADWNLRATTIEAGTHTVELRFEPKPFYAGTWISLSTIGVSVIGIFFLRKRTSES